MFELVFDAIQYHGIVRPKVRDRQVYGGDMPTAVRQ
jgi:hypothetical protein